MWQTKYASAVPKNLGLGLNLWPCSEGYFLFGHPYSVQGLNAHFFAHIFGRANFAADLEKGER